ncbi:MAG: Sapep family Mn(2+)-dependent dipeptidase [Lentisphaeria bacterium]|nr:Sapep family Mn(2+)-dependent dipeptidase [Lentisphaeria bacterium]
MSPEEFAAAFDAEALLPETLEILGKLVSFDTVRRPAEPGMPFGRRSAEALAWLIGLAERDGFEAVNLDNYCGYVEYGDGPEMIAVAGHLDVVPAGDAAEWTTPPFEMVRKDGMLCGRGVSDDKGPLAAVYVIMRELKRKNVKLKRRLRLIFGCAEETGSECLEHYRRHAETPKYGITPDANFPVICGECGIIHFSLEKKFRPGENRLKLKAGVVINAVPGRAEAEYGGKKFAAAGQAAHASHPERGDNALVKLCRELDGKVDSDFPQLVLRTDRAKLDLELEDAVSKLTLVPSVAEADEKHALLRGDLRFPVTMRSAEIVARLERAYADSGYAFAVDFVDEPLFFPPETPFIAALLDAYAEATGDRESKPLVIGGGTYAKHLANTVAFGCSFPGHDYGEHEFDEHCPEADLALAAKILARAIVKLDALE